MFIGEAATYCDMVVYDHLYSTVNGETVHSFDQLIFYEYNHQYKRHHVRNWLFVNGETERDMITVHRKSGGYDIFTFSVSVFDKSIGKNIDKKITIKTKIFKETFSMDRDLERENKKLFPEEFRNPIW